VTTLIPATVSTVVRVQPDGTEEDAILTPGLYDSQTVTIVNLASADDCTLTFAEEDTSHVARGNEVILYPSTQTTLVWDAASALWYAPLLVSVNIPEPPYPPDPEPEPPVSGMTIAARAGYGYVELQLSGAPANGQMYRYSRRVIGTSQYQVVDTVPGHYYLDASVEGGVSYEYVAAAKTPELQADCAPVSVTAVNSLPPEAPMSAVNNAIAQAAPGSAVDLPPGIYRVSKDGEPNFNKALTLRASTRDVWFLCSRNWATGGEAGNSWTQTGSYWTSSRQAPVLRPNTEEAVKITDQTVAGFYTNVTCWNSKAQQQWLKPIGSGQSPSGNQVCYVSDSDRRLRIGTNPSQWQRIEVSECLNWRSSAPSSNMTFEGLTFRGAGGGSQDPCFEIAFATNLTFSHCVFGNTHSGAISAYKGETNTDCKILLDKTWFDHCGYQCVSVTGIRGMVFKDLTFGNTGGQGYNEIWHGGCVKFVGSPRDLLFEYCRSYDTIGATFWADISAGPYEIRYCKTVRNRNFYAFSHEISIQGNVHHNLFLDGGLGTGYPTAHTDQGNTLNFHHNTVVGNDGTTGANDGKVWQFQGGTGPGTFRGDLPPGGVKDNVITDNVFIHRGKDAFDWSKEAQGRFRYDRNRWWSAAPVWKFDTWNNWVTDINVWNGIPDVGQDTFMTTAEKDRELRYWGILPDQQA
jgi:hypothetical protein